MDLQVLDDVVSVLTWIGSECAKGMASQAGRDLWSKVLGLLAWKKQPEPQDLPKAIKATIAENEPLLAQLSELAEEVKKLHSPTSVHLISDNALLFNSATISPFKVPFSSAISS